MRDFRDAKAMAHALRNGLKAKAVEATHSECLELLAKAFGFESWNVLSAKIEATQSPEPDRQAHDPRFKRGAVLLVLRQDAARGKVVNCWAVGFRLRRISGQPHP